MIIFRISETCSSFKIFLFWASASYCAYFIKVDGRTVLLRGMVLPITFEIFTPLLKWKANMRKEEWALLTCRRGNSVSRCNQVNLMGINTYIMNISVSNTETQLFDLESSLPKVKQIIRKRHL
jgi:hypothetical protein